MSLEVINILSQLLLRESLLFGKGLESIGNPLTNICFLQKFPTPSEKFA
jgi:hypothetical protein